jgi:hypothetical protein
VEITNQVQPAPVQVDVHNQPAAVNVQVEPTPVQISVEPTPIQVETPKAEVQVTVTPSERPAESETKSPNRAVIHHADGTATTAADTTGTKPRARRADSTATGDRAGSARRRRGEGVRARRSVSAGRIREDDGRNAAYSRFNQRLRIFLRARIANAGNSVRHFPG